MLNVCEIFKSIQGESSLAGYLCVFVRLSGCNLNCAWCDTRYVCDEPGEEMSVKRVLLEVGKYNVNLVEITGGEPLLQADTAVLCKKLLGAGYTVMVETNGSLDISTLPEGVHRIIDIKCPGSGMAGSFLMDNLKRLNESDELKFVLASIDDAEWASRFCIDHDEVSGCGVIFSPVSNSLPYDVLADWIVKHNLDGARLGIQLHKIIWGNIRGK